MTFFTITQLCKTTSTTTHNYFTIILLGCRLKFAYFIQYIYLIVEVSIFLVNLISRSKLKNQKLISRNIEIHYQGKHFSCRNQNVKFFLMKRVKHKCVNYRGQSFILTYKIYFDWNVKYLSMKVQINRYSTGVSS